MSNYGNVDRDIALSCIIVTFNPDPVQFSQVLDASLSQGHAVIVVDNGSSPQFVDYLQGQAAHVDELHVLSLGTNQGIASAINLGIAEAKTLHAQFVLLLDHDSVPSAGLMDMLLLAAKKKQRSGRPIAAIGAKLVDPRSGQEVGFYRMRNGYWSKIRCDTQSEGLIDCDYLNSSGSFIPISSFAAIGPFNERLFIDHVDTEWYMRAKSLGYECYGLCEGTLAHHMGDAVIRYWLFGWRYMPRRSPQRHYYIVRNSLWLYRYAYVPLAWKLNNFVKVIFTLIYFSICDTQRREQLTSILKGFLDGIRGEGRLM